MEVIRSRQNVRVKQLRAAAADNGRAGDGAWLVEGWHLLEEAARNGAALEQVFVREDAVVRWDDFAHENLLSLKPVVLAADVFDPAVSTDSPQGVAAFARPRVDSVGEALRVPAPLAVALVGIQDPGNAGTIVRSAQAFGANALFCLPGSANVYGTKALRASAGAVFSLPVFSLDWPELNTLARENKLVTLATVPRDGVAPSDVPWQEGLLLLIGAEGAGLPDDIVRDSLLRVTIPMPGETESLNAAVAASILLYEAARVR